jgi:hypothetical protein
MSMFVVQNDELIEMSPGEYVNENELQSLIERYPGLLAGADINPESPRRWLLIAREPGLATGADQSDRFSVDHLFVDQDAIPTIVEVKRSSDTRIRREIVGQMFDYAANGVKYWPIDRLREWLTARSGGADKAAENIVNLLEVEDNDRDATVESFWNRVDDNLSAGRLRLLFVADFIPHELRRIIEFLNEQMQQTEVLGIAIARHQSGGMQVLAPTVFGRTEHAAKTKREVSTIALDEIIQSADADVREVGARLDALAQQLGWDVRRGKKSKMYGRDPRGSFLTWYPSWGTVDLNLGFMRELGLEAEVASLLDALGELRGSRPSQMTPNIPCAAALQHWEAFETEWLPGYVALRTRAAEIQSGHPHG